MDISLCMKCGKRKRHERNGRVFKLCAVCALENLQTLLKGEDNEFACHSCDGTGYIDGSQCDNCGGLGFFADDYEEAKEITGNVKQRDLWHHLHWRTTATLLFGDFAIEQQIRETSDPQPFIPDRPGAYLCSEFWDGEWKPFMEVDVFWKDVVVDEEGNTRPDLVFQSPWSEYTPSVYYQKWKRI